MPKPPAKKTVDLHPSEWDPNWQPPIGNQPLPGERPHIWQEFKRDLHMKRGPGEPVIGRGWPVLAATLLMIFVMTMFSVENPPPLILAIKQMF